MEKIIRQIARDLTFNYEYAGTLNGPSHEIVYNSLRLRFSLEANEENKIAVAMRINNHSDAIIIGVYSKEELSSKKEEILTAIFRNIPKNSLA